MKVPIAEIRIGKRHRTELGDIADLSDSMAHLGLLQPIVVTQDNRLVAGWRRLQAALLLGWDSIAVHRADTLVDALALLEAERDENTCREPLLVTEAVALADAVEAIQGPKAKEAKRKHGGTAPGRKSLAKSLRKCKREPETATVAAKAAGMSRPTYERAKAVVESGDESLITEMNKTGKVGGAYRKLKAKQEHKQQQAAAKAVPPSDLWTLTAKQDVVSCQALITDPPYGILDEPWEPKKLETFTRQWAKRWAKCEADLLAVFWSQRYLWDGRAWFDESFVDYHFQQLLVWHYPNNKSPQSRMGFKQTWEPIFFYRRKDSSRKVGVGGTEWGGGLNDFDCHVAAVPQSNFNGADRKRHPAQKPVSVMRWLVNALTRPGELIADPFCGSGTTGIAALQLGRRFHGIETDKGFLKIAKGRIVAYGKAGI